MKLLIQFLMAAMLLPAISTNADTPPNIVFFIADDVSQDDFGCYGHPTIKTPNTDALAAGGMRFDNAYLTTSSCSPSRCSIITGRYPHNTGAPELHTKLPDSQVRFPELLREAGYYTVLSGKNHMFGKKDRAFDKITSGGGPGKEEDWVKHVQDRPKEKPFFFWFASTDAHRDWQITDEAPVYKKEDVVVPPYLVDTDVTRQDLADYYHEVSRFDYYVGLVTEELKKQGVLDNTMIVVSADNGRPFPRCKSRLYDSGIKTPWVVHFPEVVKQAGVTESLISVIDLSATCLELAGVERPDSVQGRSFLPVLKNPNAEVREVVFAEHNWHVYRNHERMVRFGDFVYIKNNFPNQPNLCTESDNHYPAGEELWKAHAAGKTTPEQQQVFANPCPEEELFQLSSDPHQLSNQAGNPKMESELALARELLDTWTEQTGDTIPENPTPNRFSPPRIENGKIIPAGGYKVRNPHAEMPGAAANAMERNHPGPIKLEAGESESAASHAAGEAFEDLFASGDFSGWTTVKGEPVGEGWRVKDGVVHRYGSGGDIITREKYLDFDLRFEWKISEAGNSGVKYRTREKLGLEYQVLDDEKHSDNEKANHRAGSLYELVAAPDSKPLKPVGEWNQSRIVAKGNHLEHWLNGEKVVSTEYGTDDWFERFAGSKYKKHEGFGSWEGPVLLQDHKDPVWFRNMKIRKL